MKAAQLRKQINITSDELARALGVDARTVARWDDGSCDPRGPALEALRGIEDALAAGCAPAEVGRLVARGVRSLINDALSANRKEP